MTKQVGTNRSTFDYTNIRKHPVLIYIYIYNETRSGYRLKQITHNRKQS